MERLRAASARCVKDPALAIASRAEALLYAAARAQLVEELLGAGARRRRDRCSLDRFVDSSLAYQGAGRGLGIEPVRAINASPPAGLLPDRTLLLRAGARGRPRAPGGRGAGCPTGSSARTSRLLRGDRGGLRAARAAEPDRFAVIDASAAPGDVLERGSQRTGRAALSPPLALGAVKRSLSRCLPAALALLAFPAAALGAGATVPTVTTPPTETVTPAPGTTTPGTTTPGTTTPGAAAGGAAAARDDADRHDPADGDGHDAGRHHAHTLGRRHAPHRDDDDARDHDDHRQAEERRGRLRMGDPRARCSAR